MSFKWRRRMCWSSWQQEPIWEVPTWTSRWSSMSTKEKVTVSRGEGGSIFGQWFWNDCANVMMCLFVRIFRCVYHQPEEDLGEAPACCQGYCCHWKPSWCVCHLLQEHWTGNKKFGCYSIGFQQSLPSTLLKPSTDVGVSVSEVCKSECAGFSLTPWGLLSHDWGLIVTWATVQFCHKENITSFPQIVPV